MHASAYVITTPKDIILLIGMIHLTIMTEPGSPPIMISLLCVVSGNSTGDDQSISWR